MRTERQVLVTSLVGVLVVAALGIGFGLASGSSAIVFDGVFSLVDAGMSGLSIWVAVLVARSAAGRLSRRFTYGHWHLEPMVLTVQALTMMSVAAYALVQAVLALLTGGRDIEFGAAITYAVVVLLLTLVLGLAERHANRRIGSALVAMDVKGWLMAGAVTGALLVAFLIGLVLERAGLDAATPYVDPVVLAVVATVLLPVPFSTLRSAVGQIVLATPIRLQDEAEAIASDVVRTEGFLSRRVYTAQVGRSRQIEVVFLVPADAPARPITSWDDVRRDVTHRLGGGDRNNWITVTFTADPDLT